jgi:hypothetical protein
MHAKAHATTFTIISCNFVETLAQHSGLPKQISHAVCSLLDVVHPLTLTNAGNNRCHHKKPITHAKNS